MPAGMKIVRNRIKKIFKSFAEFNEEFFLFEFEGVFFIPWLVKEPSFLKRRGASPG